MFGNSGRHKICCTAVNALSAALIHLQQVLHFAAPMLWSSVAGADTQTRLRNLPESVLVMIKHMQTLQVQPLHVVTVFYKKPALR